METVKSFELRDLCAKDIFPMTKIISKIGIKEFKECFKSNEVKKAISEIAKGEKSKDVITKEIGISITFDIVDILLSNLSACEEYIYMLLSGLSGMTKEEIAKLPIDTFAEMIIEVIKKEEFKDFIKAVSKLIK